MNNDYLHVVEPIHVEFCEKCGKKLIAVPNGKFSLMTGEKLYKMECPMIKTLLEQHSAELEEIRKEYREYEEKPWLVKMLEQKPSSPNPTFPVGTFGHTVIDQYQKIRRGES